MGPRWPKWGAVKDLFSSNVEGELEIIPFSMSTHHPEFPWFDKAESRQYRGGSNPLHVTARHFCLELPQFQPDFLVAYKLHAFAREHELTGFALAVLNPIFKQHGTALYEWWNGNSKYVMPLTERTEYLRLRPDGEQAKEWSTIVLEAAADWTFIHREWAVIRIPRLMEHDSAEYLAYQASCKREYESIERREYERLRAKFDS